MPSPRHPEPTTRERWAEIPGYPGYRASDFGRLQSRRRRGPGAALADEWHDLKPKTGGGGHHFVTVSAESRTVSLPVHRAVLLAFDPVPNADRRLVRHLNGIPTDNRLVNLVWGTPAQNTADRMWHAGVGSGTVRPTPDGEGIDGPPPDMPSYRRHRNEARCWVGGRWVSLGVYGSPTSRAEYARICAEVAAGAVPPRVSAAGTSVAELIAAFKVHVERYHVRPDGTKTKEVDEFKQALRLVRDRYGDTPAKDFGPVALKTVRDAMVKKGWCRSRVNKQIGRVRRCWKWGVSEELVPETVWAALKLVDGLRRNRSAARETKPVTPVVEADYLATLPACVPTVRAMLQLQRLGGLRPVEVRHLTPADVDTTGELWVYRPAEHKMSHLGVLKAIPLPPSARAVLEPWLAGKKPGEIVFSPSAAREEMYAERRSRRVSKVTPCQVSRRKPTEALKKRWATVFTDAGYAKQVRRACKRAGVKTWRPNQLRHAFGTEVRERFGLDVAQLLLGHANAKVTEVYAEASARKAAEAARAMG